mgnify:CR=1 FL=1
MEHASPANRLFWKDLGIRCLFVISIMKSLLRKSLRYTEPQLAMI